MASSRTEGDEALFALVSRIAAGDRIGSGRLLDASPGLAQQAMGVGASRSEATPYFLTPISHYVYPGDTALHIAAAAFQRDVAEALLEKGADVRARNRRGAEPLHYAADGAPQKEHCSPGAQRAVIACLIAAGAEPDALDKSGVAALHRAVRRRSSEAVQALIDAGADLRLQNKNGSTPLHLAVQNTGASNSGTQDAKQEQRSIIGLLLRHGAKGTDVGRNGKSVLASASSDWIREVLETS